MVLASAGGVVLQNAGLFAGLGLLLLFIVLLPALIVTAGLWKVFTKAGQPGWAAIVPIYNIYVLLQIVGRPTIWLVGFIIPGVNIVVGILVTLDLVKAYGKGAGFAVGIILVPFVFIPLLGFGSAQYQGPVHGSQQAQPQGTAQV